MENISKLLKHKKRTSMNEFLEISDKILEHYKALNDRVTQEFIAVNVLSVLNEKKNRKNLVMDYVDPPVIEKYALLSQELVSRRYVIQTGQMILVTIIVGVISFFVLKNTLRISDLFSLIISMLITFLVAYIFNSTSSKRLISNSKKLYDQKVDKKVIDFYKHYLS